MSENSNERLPAASSQRIERVVRKYRLGEEPSMVDEYAHLSIDERLELFIDLRDRVIKGQYETDPGFERVLRIARFS